MGEMDPADGASPQRRAFPRIPLRAKARMEFAEQRYFLSEWAVNLSPGGMFVRSESPMTAGQRFHFDASLTPRGPVFSGIGEVTWVRHDWEGGARPPGFAVRFLEIDEQGRATMIQLAQTFVEKGAAAMQDELRAMAADWYQRFLAEEREEAGGTRAPFPDTDELGRPWPEASEGDAEGSRAAAPAAVPAATPPAASDDDPVDIALADTDPGVTPRFESSPPESASADPPATPPRRRVWWLGVLALLVGGGVIAALAWLPAHGAPETPPPPPPTARVAPRPAVPPAVAPGGREIAAATAFAGLARVSWTTEREGLWVVLELDGALPAESLRRFRPDGEPPREVIQLLGASRGYEPSVLPVHSPLLEQIRVGFHPGEGDELRVVLDLPRPAVAVRRVERDASAVRILLADVGGDPTRGAANELAHASLNAVPTDGPANQPASALAAAPASTVPQ
jgi:uncharacterized protein (TIGR02266 family)